MRWTAGRVVRRTAGRLGLLVSLAGLLALPPASARAEFICPLAPTLVLGYGIVGAHQYDQGDRHGTVVISQTVWCVGEHWAFGGIGWGNRSSQGFVQPPPPDEMGTAFPGVTYRRGKWVAQVGVTVQGVAKYFWYGGLGFTPWTRGKHPRAAAAPVPVAPPAASVPPPAAPVASPAAPASGPLRSFRVLRQLALGGDGGWDYLAIDPATRRLFVSRGTRVAVVDADTGAAVGDLADTPGVHGIALAPDLGRGFASNGRAGTVTLFDLRSLAVLGQVETGANPDAILYDAATRRVFTFNGGSRDATVIDAASGAVVATIPLQAKPEFAVADELGRVYVNLEDTSEIAVIDARRAVVERRWPLAPCQEPTGLALDVTHRRLFAGCGNRTMAVVDADQGDVVATLPIGAGVDGVAFDAERQLAFASNGDGTLTVVHEDSPERYRVVQNVPTQRGARTIVLDPRTHALYLPTAQLGPAPPPTPERPRPRPAILPGTFVVLVVGS